MGGRFTIIGLGEILWDVFEDGKALGGAPCNFAYHVCALGHSGLPFSRVGEDRLGDEILSALERLGIPTEFIQRDPVVAVEACSEGCTSRLVERAGARIVRQIFADQVLAELGFDVSHTPHEEFHLDHPAVVALARRITQVARQVLEGAEEVKGE